MKSRRSCGWIVDALDDKRQFSCKVGGRAEQEARLENPPSLAEAEAISDSVRAFNARAGP